CRWSSPPLPSSDSNRLDCPGSVHAGIAQGDVRVMARNDLGTRPRELLQEVVCRVHLHEVTYHGKGSVELELVVEVRRVRREHDISSLAPDDCDQLTGRVASDGRCGHPFGDLLGSLDEPHATCGGRRPDERDLTLLDDRRELEAPGHRAGPE